MRRVAGTERRKTGREQETEYEVELIGVDIYDPLKGEVKSTGAAKVAAWFLDSDYNAPRFEEGMFVSRVHGKSMEPAILDGSYRLFRRPGAGTRQGRTLLVWHEGIDDPHTGGRYTVKVYESEKRGREEGEWEHARIILKPTNPDYPPIVLAPEDEDEVRVIAEFVQVIA